MIVVKSLLKINESFYELNQVSQNDLIDIDWEYVEGAIEISFYNCVLIGKEIWDDINWFWGYVADNFNEFFESGIYSIGYPSQPINFEIINKNSKIITLKIYDNFTRYVEKDLPKVNFLHSFLNEANNYFQFEKVYSNEDELEINRKINNIDMLINKI